MIPIVDVNTVSSTKNKSDAYGATLGPFGATTALAAVRFRVVAAVLL